MLTYDQTMAAGREQYADVIEDLTRSGLPTEFTQTGGMNAGLEIRLDGGFSILVTEADDSLAWSREEHRDWGAALFPPEDQYDGECLAADVTDDGSIPALRELIQRLLLKAVEVRNN